MTFCRAERIHVDLMTFNRTTAARNESLTSESTMPLSNTSRMRRTVASCACLFKFIGGILSIPLDIACGLNQNGTPRLDALRDRSTYHKTRTDHPICSEWLLKILNNPVRLSWLSVFESTKPSVTNNRKSSKSTTYLQTPGHPDHPSKLQGKRQPHRPWDPRPALSQLRPHPEYTAQGRWVGENDKCTILR